MPPKDAKRTRASSSSSDKEEDTSNSTEKPGLKRARRLSSPGGDASVAAKTGDDQPQKEPLDFASLEEGSVNLSKIDDLVDMMLTQLQTLKKHYDNSSSPPRSQEDNAALLSCLSRGLLTLRAWQRGLLQHTWTVEKSCQEASQARQAEAQAWASLQYEKAHLEQDIAAVNNFGIPHLDQVLAGSMLQLEPNNPNHRQAILQHLQTEIQQRSKLEKQRDALKNQLASVQRQYQQEQKKLGQLPRKLDALEQATKPLQQWFALPFLGTDRRERLQLALQLPGPLYTLFVSLQNFLDLLQSLDDTTSSPKSPPQPKMSLSIVAPAIGGVAGTATSENGQETSQPHEIQWTLPVLDVAIQSRASLSSSSSSKSSKQSTFVTLHFHYHPAATMGPRCITTTVSGATTALDQTWLLTCLFPPLIQHPFSDERDGYYRWVHYLAGIHLVGKHNVNESSIQDYAVSWSSPIITPNITIPSTRNIVQTLQRRIRANATLKYILHSLSTQHKIPNAPPTPSAPYDVVLAAAAGWQLVSFAAVAAAAAAAAQPPKAASSNGKTVSSVFAFDVHCKKTLPGRTHKKSCELHATVKIDKAQYPSVPPRWKIGKSETNSAATAAETTAATTTTTTTTFNHTWHLLENLVNRDLLAEIHRIINGDGGTKDGDRKIRLKDGDVHMEDTDDDFKPTAAVSAAMVENGQHGKSNVVDLDDAMDTNIQSPDAKEEEDQEEEAEEALLFAEWILVHQLNCLLSEFEQAETGTVGMRRVRGRDRVPLNLSRTKTKS